MLTLVKHPNEILDKYVPEFDFDNSPVPAPLLELQMLELMVSENGIGLAANQIGLDARVFTMKTQLLEDVIAPFAVFNPEVISVSEEMEADYEGCLSFPNLFFKVNRPKAIVVKFLDRHKKECIIELSGIDARCFLHELDHLNGICFIDRVSKLKLDLAIKKQRKRNGRTK